MRLNIIIKCLIAISIAAAVPLLFFFVTPSAKLNIPPYYRPEQIISRMEKGKTVRDTLFHQVKDITLTNQLGQKVSLNKDLKGKVLVIDFIFTTCPSVCPRLSANMKELQKAYIKKNPEMVQFISISVDPDRDSVEALRAYANRYDADHDRWWFLTGNKDSIFDYAKNELGLLLENADVPGDFVHSQKMILIDTARNIRGYFDGLDKAQTKKIADDIYILNVEKRKHHR